MIHLPLLEIRPTADAVTDAIAYEENGRIVVEVDDTLTGRKRRAAIMAALAPYLHGPRILALPVLLAAWRLSRKVVEHPQIASALAGTAATVAAGAVALTAVGVWDQQGPPPYAEPAATLIYTVTTSRPNATPAPSTATRTTPSRDVGAPSSGRPEPSDTSVRPSWIQPSRTPRATVAATSSARPTKPPPTRTRAASTPKPTVDAVAAAEDRPEPTSAPPPTTADESTVDAAADKPPASTSRDCGGIVDVDVNLDPLGVNVCLLD